MTKPLSELITSETKTEDLFDLLKGGFSVDAKSVPIICKLDLKQEKRLDRRVFRRDLYSDDNSVFLALNCSYPISELSRDDIFSDINRLYESLSKMIIDDQITYFKKSFGLKPGKYGLTDEQMYKWGSLFQEHNKELKLIQEQILTNESFAEWYRLFERKNEDFANEARLSWEEYDKKTENNIPKQIFRSNYLHKLAEIHYFLKDIFDKTKNVPVLWI